MKWLQFFSTSIGKKLLVGATGFFLCTFLIVHLAGNLSLMKDDGGQAFNLYADFMGHNPLIQTLAWGLKVVILIHAFLAIQLTIRNQAARPVKYAVKPGNSTTSWFSRQMAVMGSLLLIFLVIHLANFWWKMHFGSLNTAIYDGKEVGDLYTPVWFAFENVGLVILYVVGMIALSFHLIHGFKSSMQTFGWNHPKYNGMINFVGLWIFGILIPLLFAVIPVYIYCKQI